MKTNTPEFLVTALYKFVSLDNLETLQKSLKQFCLNNKIYGTLLIAEEGINGTIAGSKQAIEKFHEFLKSDERFADIGHKESWAEFQPFQRMKVRIKKEIVTLGEPTVDPTKVVGTYVSPENWNEVISDPEVVNIDTRNDYEYNIGTFEGALNPDTKSFREFKDYVRKNLDPKKNKKVAMFCTGGIRCEKASSFMLNEGFETVYHLKGGILQYLEDVPKKESMWEGDCFVFDDRVAVTHGLEKGEHTECHACRLPIKPEDMKKDSFELGVSCHHCIDETDNAFKDRMRERQKQIELAKKRGEKHFSIEAMEQGRQRKELKRQADREASNKTRV
ncbi:MAG: rhodanese-related sulfurtransferase [Alphaproteobacteria bacterium]